MMPVPSARASPIAPSSPCQACQTSAGRSAIEALFADIFSKVTFKQFTLTPQRLDVYGDVAYEIGTHGEILEPRGGAAHTVQSTYIIVRHHQPDGSWKIERLLVVPGP